MTRYNSNPIYDYLQDYFVEQEGQPENDFGYEMNDLLYDFTSDEEYYDEDYGEEEILLIGKPLLMNPETLYQTQIDKKLSQEIDYSDNDLDFPLDDQE